MKKKKYGEETVVIRVPVSKKEEVLKFLEQFEVIGHLSPDKIDSSNPLHEAYIQGYLDCYDKWSEYHYGLPLVLIGQSEKVPLYLDMMRGRVPESAVLSVTKEITDIFIKNAKKMKRVEGQLEELENLIDFAWSDISDRASAFLKLRSVFAIEQGIKVVKEIEK